MLYVLKKNKIRNILFVLKHTRFAFRLFYRDMDFVPRKWLWSFKLGWKCLPALRKLRIWQWFCRYPWSKKTHQTYWHFREKSIVAHYSWIYIIIWGGLNFKKIYILSSSNYIFFYSKLIYNKYNIYEKTLIGKLLIIPLYLTKCWKYSIIKYIICMLW